MSWAQTLSLVCSIGGAIWSTCPEVGISVFPINANGASAQSVSHECDGGQFVKRATGLAICYIVQDSSSSGVWTQLIVPVSASGYISSLSLKAPVD